MDVSPTCGALVRSNDDRLLGATSEIALLDPATEAENASATP